MKRKKRNQFLLCFGMQYSAGNKQTPKDTDESIHICKAE